MANTPAQLLPFQSLQDLERRARQKAKGIPRQEKIQQFWRGIAFRIGQSVLVSPLQEIREVLICPTVLARVPGAKPWVKGLANIRGLLMPVIDLQACLSNKITLVSNRTRMLIINQSGISAGLLVDEVIGIKHFPEQNRDLETPCKEAWLVPFTRGMFIDENEQWIVFDMHALTENDQFLKAAL